MLAKGFISGVLKIDKIFLGKTEEYFLSLFLQYSKLSAYDIFKELKRQSKSNEPRTVDAMAYKNVHEKIKRLQSLKLIKQLNREFPRKTKMYMLTNKGLFQLMLTKYSFNVAFYLTSGCINFKGYLIDSILFQFFEVETVKQFCTLYRQIPLAEYLSNCCRAIQKKVEQLGLSHSISKAQNSSVEFENLIKNEAKKFIFRIVIESEKNYENVLKSKNESSEPSNKYLYPQIDGKDPNYSSYFPTAVLNNDKKFLKILKEIKDDFDKGIKDYSVSLKYIN